jgi:hypothetical protein
MGLLACVLRLSGPTHGSPPCSSLPSSGDVVPMVPNLVSSPRMLAKRALIPINHIFLSWQSYQVLCSTWNNSLSQFSSGQVINGSDWVHQVSLKTRIGAPRCCPRLSYQISSRIDSGVKICYYSECRLIFPLDPGIRDQIYSIYHYFPLLRIDGIKLFLPLG